MSNNLFLKFDGLLKIRLIALQEDWEMINKEDKSSNICDFREDSPEKGLNLTGYYPGVIGKITELHATYYHTHWGLDQSFETQVARELSEFISSFDPARDSIWVAHLGDDFAGSVAIDGSKRATDGARLRWFIVNPSCQRCGIGEILLSKSVSFCRERGFPRIFLWTFKGLDQARRLYERFGFRLTEEHEVDQWGQKIREQRFDLLLPV